MMNGRKIGIGSIVLSATLATFTCSADQVGNLGLPDTQLESNDLKQFDLIKCDDVKEFGSRTDSITLCKLRQKGGNRWTADYKLTPAGLILYTPSPNLVAPYTPVGG